MVVADAPGLAKDLLGSITASSEATYSQGINRFAEFMREKGLDQTVFQHGIIASQAVVISFIRWLRLRTRFDGKLNPPRHRPVTSDHINSLVTHLVKWVERRDSVISLSLRSPTSAALLAAYAKTDIDIRGPIDAYCIYPLSCEFLHQSLMELERRYGNDPAALALHSAVLMSEYGFGGRVYELLDPDQGKHPELAPESDREVINHSANCEDLLLRWTEEGEWYHIYEAHRFPSGIPMVAQLMLSHTKNHAKGPEPVAIWSNPKGPDSPFCVCAALLSYAVHWKGTLRRGTKLFAHADEKILR